MDSFELTKDTLIIHDKKEFLSYLRKNKITKEKFLVNHFNKKDLYNGEPLLYKNEEYYLNNDFNSRENLNNYLVSVDRSIAKQYCLDFFKKRKIKKNLVFAPSQIELKSFIAPSINIIQKGLGLNYNNFITEVGLIPRFNYKGSYKTNCLGEVKVICDTREQKLLKFKNIEIRKLEIGDYTVLEPYHCGVFIERKSLPDLIGSLSPQNFERFVAEIARAKSMGYYLIVVIESDFNNLIRMKDLNYIKSNISPDFILHKIRSLMEVNDHLQFLFVSNRIQALKIIDKIFRLKEQVKNIDLEYVYNIGKI